MANTDDDPTSVSQPSLFDRTQIPRREHPRDEVWDALAEWFGEPATRTERTLRNRLILSFHEAGATAEQVHARAHAWSSLFPGAQLTPTALEKHWTQLGLAPLQQPADFARHGHDNCPHCGGSGLTHTYSPGAGMVATPCTKGA